MFNSMCYLPILSKWFLIENVSVQRRNTYTNAVWQKPFSIRGGLHVACRGNMWDVYELCSCMHQSFSSSQFNIRRMLNVSACEWWMHLYSLPTHCTLAICHQNELELHQYISRNSSSKNEILFSYAAVFICGIFVGLRCFMFLNDYVAFWKVHFVIMHKPLLSKNEINVWIIFLVL